MGRRRVRHALPTTRTRPSNVAARSEVSCPEYPVSRS